MNVPNLYTSEEIVAISGSTRTFTGSRWIPLRPLGYSGLAVLRRLRLAYLVFIGRYDAINWEQLQEHQQ